MSDKWAQPQEVSNALSVFPGDVRHLMPAMEEIPSEFKGSSNPWVKFQSKWFFFGLGDMEGVILADGVDGDLAFRHLGCIQGSYQPKHEHKEAAVAYLASRWFKEVIWKGSGDDDRGSG